MRDDDDFDVGSWRADPGKAPGLSSGKMALAAGAVALGIGVYLIAPLEWALPSFFGSGSATTAVQEPMAGSMPDLKELKGLASRHEAKPPVQPVPLVAVAQAAPDTSIMDELRRQYEDKYRFMEEQYNAVNGKLNELLGQTKTETVIATPKQAPQQKVKTVKPVDPEAQKRAAAAKQRREEMLSSPTGFLTRPKEDVVGQLHALKSPYSLAPSEEIPCETTMTISSETPGAFVAVVSQDVPDTATRQRNVIPKGSKFVLKPRRSTIMGDSRIDIQAQTLTFPSGPWLKVPASTMTDRYGTAGFTGEVDRHLLRNYGAVILTGVLRGGSTIVAGGYGGSASDRVTGAIAQDTAAEATRDMRQFIRTDPTITVPSTPEKRYTCRLLLEEELVLTRAYPWTK